MPTPAEIVRLNWEGLEQEPRDLHLEFFDVDAEIHNPDAFPLTGPFRGHEGIRRWANEVWEVFSDLHHEVEELIEVDEETVVSVQRTQGEMRHTGIPVDIPWAAVWRFRDGKVVRAEGYMSRAEAIDAPGV